MHGVTSPSNPEHEVRGNPQALEVGADAVGLKTHDHEAIEREAVERGRLKPLGRVHGKTEERLRPQAVHHGDELEIRFLQRHVADLRNLAG